MPAKIKRADQSDGKKRFRLAVIVGEDRIVEDVIVPDDETDVRAYLTNRARLFYRTIKRRQRLAADEVVEQGKWRALTDEPDITDVELQA